MPKRPRIAVVGSANVDLTTFTDRFPKPGETIFGQKFDIPLETVYYTIAFARKHGIRCILNPAPGQPIDITAVKDLDYFVPNESEAETITGMPVRNLDDAKKCAAKLLGDGIGRVIITIGANGSLLASRDGMEHPAAFTVEGLH